MEQKTFNLSVVVLLVILVIGILWAINRQQRLALNQSAQMAISSYQYQQKGQNKTTINFVPDGEGDSFKAPQPASVTGIMNQEDFLKRNGFTLDQTRPESFSNGTDMMLPLVITHSKTIEGDFFGIAPDPISGRTSAAQSIYFFKNKKCSDQEVKTAGDYCTQFNTGALVAGTSDGIIGDLYGVLKGMYR